MLTVAKTLYVNGQATEQIMSATERLVGTLGLRATILPAGGGLQLLTEERTVQGKADLAGVEMDRIASAMHLVDAVEAGGLAPAESRRDWHGSSELRPFRCLAASACYSATMIEATTRPPRFDAAFREKFTELLRWRRDVRRFRADPVDERLLDRLLALASLAPSVGLSQPWRFVLVETPARREAIAANFARANDAALNGYAGERQARYARLKLEGLRQAPVHLVVCADETTAQGHGLGRQSMPETLRYSAVAAIQTLWLAARSEGLGVGWVSILDPAAARATLDLPEAWSLVAYLCLGWPEEEHDDPELERHGWEQRCEAPVTPLRR